MKNNEQICQNCKSYFEDHDGVGHCEEGVSDGSETTNYQVSDYDVVEYNFGCNKFTEKEQK